MKIKRIVLLSIWLLILSSGPITVLFNTPISTALNDDILFVNFLQRIFGLLAFTMLGSQIILGSNMKWWIRMVGAKAYRYHITEGIVAYLFILLHPLMQVILYFKAEGPYFGLLAFIFEKNVFINLGKLAFILLTISIIAAYFRTKPFFRKNWNKLHLLNYFSFFIIAFHSWAIGTDVKTYPFVTIYTLMIICVFLGIIETIKQAKKLIGI